MQQQQQHFQLQQFRQQQQQQQQQQQLQPSQQQVIGQLQRTTSGQPSQGQGYGQYGAPYWVVKTPKLSRASHHNRSVSKEKVANNSRMSSKKSSNEVSIVLWDAISI